MSDFEEVDCSCGYTYFTRRSFSRCPNCGKSNSSLSSALLLGLFIIGLILIAILIFGPLAYAINAVEKKWKIYHQYIAIFLAVIAISFWWYYYSSPDSNGNWILYVGIFVNLCAIAYSIISIYDYSKTIEDFSIPLIHAYVSAWSRSFDYVGRSNRRDFWWYFLASSIVLFILFRVKNPQFLTVYTQAMIFPTFPLVVRRLRDIGKSWVWIFIGLIPLIGAIWLIVLFCLPSLNS